MVHFDFKLTASTRKIEKKKKKKKKKTKPLYFTFTFASSSKMTTWNQIEIQENRENVKSD
jgi:hypothetical protein